MFVSVILQFAIHFGCLVYTLDIARAYAPESSEPIDPDADFSPNLVNSAVFLISCAMQVTTFAVNYQGHPFMQSLPENKGIVRVCLFVLFICVFQIIFT